VICEWIQWKISQAADDGQPLSAFAQRHLPRCRACRAYHARCERLAHELADTAQDGLALPVVAALRVVPRPALVGQRHLALWPAAATLAVLLLTAVALRYSSLVAPNSDPQQAVSSAAVELTPAAGIPTPSTSMEPLSPRAVLSWMDAALLQRTQADLDAELARLRGDARFAADLVLACL
jgi:hypothetical protein